LAHVATPPRSNRRDGLAGLLGNARQFLFGARLRRQEESEEEEETGVVEDSNESFMNY